MKYHWLARFLVVVGAAGWLTACGSSDEVKCADGTVKDGNQCVALAPDGSTCAAGTTFVDGKCVADAPDGSACADGTSFVDGQCVADAPDGSSCAAGTTFINGQCVPSEEACAAPTIFEDGRCVIKADICDAGTQLDPNTNRCVLTDELCNQNTAIKVDDDGTTRCVPVDSVCDAGTSFDLDSGLCVPDATCKEGDAILNGVCVSPIEDLAARADLSETENNDPTLGGTAESIEIPAVGSQFVIAGTIGAPTDLNGDGVADQDVDVFEFDAQAGDWLQVSVQSTGQFAPAFVVKGPNGYVRQSYLGGASASARQLVATDSGRYTLTILPAIALNTDARVGPQGADDWHYAATLKAMDAPAAQPVDLSSGRATFSGNLLDLSNNLFELTAARPGDLIQLSATRAPGAVRGIIETWIDATTLESVHPLAQSERYVVDAPDTGNKQILLDWTHASSDAAEFSITAEVVGAAQTLTIAPESSHSVQIDAAHLDILQVLFTAADGVNLDVAITAPNGSEVVSKSALGAAQLLRELAYYTGTYTIEVTNPNDTQTADISLQVSTEPITDLGLLETSAQVTTAPYFLPNEELRFYTFEVQPGHYFRLSQENLEGTASMRYEIFDPTGDLLASGTILAAENYANDGKLDFFSESGGRYVVRIEGGADLWDWQLKLRTFEPTLLGQPQAGAPVSSGVRRYAKNDTEIFSVQASAGQVLRIFHDNQTARQARVEVRRQTTQAQLAMESTLYPLSHNTPREVAFFVPADDIYHITFKAGYDLRDEVLTVDVGDADDAGDIGVGQNTSAIEMAMNNNELKWVLVTLNERGLLSLTHDNQEAKAFDIQVFGPRGDEIAKDTSVGAQSSTSSKKSLSFVAYTPGTYALLYKAKADLSLAQFNIELHPAPLVDRGEIQPGSDNSTAPLELAGSTEYYFAYQIPAGHIIQFSQENDDTGSGTVEANLFSSDGASIVKKTSWYRKGATLGPDYFTHLAADATEVYLYIKKWSTSATYDRRNLVITAQAHAPEDLGVIPANGAYQIAGSNPIAKRDDTYYRVTFDEPVSLSGTVDTTSAGTPYVTIYDENFVEIKKSTAAKTLTRRGFPAGTYIIGVGGNTTGEMADHSVDLVIHPGYTLNP